MGRAKSLCLRKCVLFRKRESGIKKKKKVDSGNTRVKNGIARVSAPLKEDPVVPAIDEHERKGANCKVGLRRFSTRKISPWGGFGPGEGGGGEGKKPM